jgi:Protein of unknown function (DUF2852)
MYTAPSASAPSGGFAGRMRQTEAWLDRKGKFAWIAATVLGFVFFWPVGLALLAYMIWSKRMFSHSCHSGDRRARWAAKMERKFADRGFPGDRSGYAYGGTGNTAFDTYKADALRRLEEEQEAFESFIQRLRDAKDKAQFDSFMDDRARANREATAQADTIDAEAGPTVTKATPASDAENRGGAY